MKAENNIGAARHWKRAEGHTKWSERNVRAAKAYRCDAKEKQEKSKDVFLLNNSFGNFFSKLTHHS
jgi:hypothetical protein